MKVDQVQGAALSESTAEEPDEEIIPEIIPASVTEPMDEGAPLRDTGLAGDVQLSVNVAEEEPVKMDEVLPLIDPVEAEMDTPIDSHVMLEMDAASPLVDPVEANTNTAPKRAIIVEVIDTPETRRAQAMARKKAKLEAKAAEGSKQDAAGGQTFTPGDLGRFLIFVCDGCIAHTCVQCGQKPVCF